MLWILLATLGVPIWLIVGALAGALLSRRAFKNAPGVFRAKLRVTRGAARGLKPNWARMPAYAAWVHDVLIVQEGLALIRSKALPVSSAADIKVMSQEAVKGLGDMPSVLTLLLDNGATVELAAPAEASELMVGPFKDALISPSSLGAVGPPDVAAV